MVEAFPPVVTERSRVLILGTMPSVKSLEKHQYYGNPRNHFWPLLYGLFGLPPDDDYGRRLAFAISRGVALWDVLANCEREGSMDAAIAAPEANDFAAFLRRYPQIGAIFFNGAKAEELFRKLALPAVERAGLQPQLQTLPSSSPARAMPLQRKQAAWHPVKEALAT